ncbi:MAG: hypothetical protein H7Y01_11255 [Ferruginibacter sp.]|nr:hypothetical protein [Chitinophagaceae bacterium]
MKKLFLLLSFLSSLIVSSQEFTDTSFSTRGFTYSCKYNFNAGDDNRVFDRAEQPAHYPGGDAEWKKFIKKNLDEKLKGRHEVQIRFQVEKSGELTDFILLNKAPARKYEEVIRLLQSSGKWFPSKQNGFCVKSYVRMMFAL